MKTSITFADSYDSSEITVKISTENDSYILEVDGDDVWFKPEAFADFITELQNFYCKNEQLKEE